LETIQQARADLEQEGKSGRTEDIQATAERAKKQAETHESKQERSRSETLAETWDKETK